MILKAIAIALLSLAAMFSTNIEASPKQTVVIAHGYFTGTQIEKPDLSSIITELESLGYKVYYPALSNDLMVAPYQIRDAVTQAYKDSPGVKPHLFGISLGGVSSLYYAKILGGYPYIASITMIDSPLYGEDIDGCPPWVHYCSNSWFMAQLHYGSDTPRLFGKPMYKQIIATEGKFTKLLDGSPCVVKFPGEHLDIASQPGFRDEILQSLSGVC